MVPVISFVGRSNVGKTTILEKVISELKSRGHRLAVIKHDSHGFEIDQPGKDSWRLTKAGSDVVVLSSSDKVAMISKPAAEPSLDRLIPLAADDVDIIITEGFKTADKPKIEVFRAAVSDKLLTADKGLVALVTDKHFDIDVPQFAFEDACGIAGFIEENYIQRPQECDVSLRVNGADIGMKPFVKDALIKTITGLVSSLQGTESARDIKIEIHIP
jgi:molybdopterin-guanine dinucleotide biosynthesis protein B